jgi:putative ABC transport system permease protein
MFEVLHQHVANLLQDGRYALRLLRKRPVISGLTVMVLALGLGGTIAVFAVIDTLVVRELPYRDSDRIVTVWLAEADRPEERVAVAPAAFLEWRSRARSFTAIAAANPWSFDYLEGPEPITLVGALVTEGFFEALGVQPAIGRLFLSEEYEQGRSDVVLLSHGAWQRIFGSEPSVVGQAVMLDGRQQLIVGVLPKWFHPDLLRGPREQDFWAPHAIREFERQDRRGRYWNVVGRLAPGVSVEQAHAELATITEQLGREYPQALGAVAATLLPLRQHLTTRIRDPLLALFVAVVLVLLLACANVAGLLLAMTANREREFALRLAIGATRWRLARQTLVESLILVTIACAVGVALARAAVDTFVVTGSATVPQLAELALDSRLAIIAIFIAGAIAILVGLSPAVRLSKADVRSGLHGVGTTADRRQRRFVSLLVATEVAATLVLLVCAGLLIRSFLSLVRVDPGFSAANIAVLQVFVYGDRYQNDGQRLAFFDQVLERFRNVPGVEKVGLVSAMPFASANVNLQRGVRVEGRPHVPADETPMAFVTVATAGYFDAMRIQVRSGRVFSDADHAQAIPVAVISDLLAERFWPNESPLNQQISVNWQGRWRTMDVVGVIGRLRHDGLDGESRPEVFMPFVQAPFGSMTFVVRASNDAAALIPMLKARIWEVDPTMPLYDTATLETLVSASLAPRRFLTDLFGVLAVLAFVLSTFGMYGLLTFATVQRTREIGIRIALGARATAILRMTLAESLKIVCVGVIVGLMGSLAATRLLVALLYRTSPTDTFTFAFTTILLAAVALVACYVPARRATKVDPLIALKA